MNIYKCEKCDIQLLSLKDMDQPCKNPGLELLQANTVDAAVEKHVPVASIQQDGVKVQVGSTPHPMLPEHHIEWIYVKTSFGGIYCNLEPGDPPEAFFRLVPDEVEEVYEYCNLHGLWKAKAPVLPLTFDTNDVACSPEFSDGCVNPSANA